MKIRQTFIFLILGALLLWVANGVQKKNLKKSLSTTADTKSAKFHSIELKRRTLSKDSKAKVFNFLAETQTMLKNPLSKGEMFLEKLQASTRSQHLIRLSNYQNTQFTGIISLTSPSNQFEAIFDTGSANMWLNSVDCSDVGCIIHKQYDPSGSSTFQNTGLLLEVEFGTGTLSGEVCSDNIYLGNVLIENQNFAKIENELGEIFAESHFDAIVGLAYPSMAAYGLQPLFDGIMSQKKLDNNIFSFYFDLTDGADYSKLLLGGIDTSLISEPVIFFPVIDKYYWMIEAENILINGQDYGLCVGGCKLVADTGTSFITGPTDGLVMVLDLLSVTNDCSNIGSLVNITYVLKGGSEDPKQAASGQNKEFTLTASDYVIGMDGPDGQCISGIMPLDVPEPRGPLWILGDIFLAKYFSVYDRDNDVVGFAPAIPGLI